MARASDNHLPELYRLRSDVDMLTKKVDDLGKQIQELQARRWPVQQVLVVAAVLSLCFTAWMVFHG